MSREILENWSLTEEPKHPLTVGGMAPRVQQLAAICRHGQHAGGRHAWNALWHGMAWPHWQRDRALPQHPPCFYTCLQVPLLLEGQSALGRDVGLIIDLANHDCL